MACQTGEAFTARYGNDFRGLFVMLENEATLAIMSEDDIGIPEVPRRRDMADLPAINRVPDLDAVRRKMDNTLLVGE